MDLQEQINSLTTEKNNYLSLIERCNTEKIALDQMFINSAKEIHALKVEILIKDNVINDLNKQINELLEDKKSLQNSLSVMQSDAQSGG